MGDDGASRVRERLLSTRARCLALCVTVSAFSCTPPPPADASPGDTGSMFDAADSSRLDATTDSVPPLDAPDAGADGSDADGAVQIDAGPDAVIPPDAADTGSPADASPTDVVPLDTSGTPTEWDLIRWDIDQWQ